jgi:hypothetical protein
VKSNAADVTRATLDDGLRVVLVRDAMAPVVTTEMKCLAGSDEVPASFLSMVHAVEYIIFRGSPRPVEGSAGGDRSEHVERSTCIPRRQWPRITSWRWHRICVWHCM